MDTTTRRWVEESPYCQALGVALEHLDADRVRLALPYQDANSNPGQALHGGCAASLGAIAGQALARSALGPDSGPWHTVQMQIAYLAAAIAEDIVAEAKLLRRGKELCFLSVEIATAAGKPIARTLNTVRGRFGAPAAEAASSKGDHGQADPGQMGPHIGLVPFIGNRGISVEHMTEGTSRLVMPWRQENADLDGGIHEGAILALLDTTGAMASWAESGPGPYKASTPSLQLQGLGPTPRDDLVAYGRCTQNDREMFWADVEVVSVGDHRIRARGTVAYRILRP